MIIDKIYVSSSRPSTTNILWLKPLANGEFALYAFLKGRWSLLRIMKSGGTLSPDDDTPEEEGEGYTKEETDTLFLRKRVEQGGQYAERGLVTSMVNTIDGVGTLSTNAYAGGVTIGNNTNMLTLSPNEIVKSVAYGFPVSVVWADTATSQIPVATAEANGLMSAEDKQKIMDIEAVIPEQVSSSNKLADKDFVNSSIATATATYRGSYNLVSDLSLTVSATQQQIAEALATKMAALSITPDNNDYCFVQIPTADATPTEIARIDRYKYDGTAWAYEYSLNNSSFTAAQWAAINSDITSGLVAKLSDLPTATELATLLSGKASTQELAGKEEKMPITTATGATLSAVVGNYYRLDNVGILEITLPTITGATKLQAITFLLVCGSNAVVSFVPQDSETILYQEDFALEADTTYEVTALWNGSEWTLSRVIYG